MFFEKIKQISPLKHEFTEVLANIAVMPKMLYYCGKLPENVVFLPKNARFGSEKPPETAENVAKSAEIVKNSRFLPENAGNLVKSGGKSAKIGENGHFLSENTEKSAQNTENAVKTAENTENLAEDAEKIPENGDFLAKNEEKTAENGKSPSKSAKKSASSANFAANAPQTRSEPAGTVFAAESRLTALSRRRPVVAIVGARKMTAYGREVAHAAAFACARAGAVVVSGLAYGIDAMAHRGALDAGGLTVAVLGTPFARGIYPRENTGLAREIVAGGGAILTEVGDHDRYDFKATFLKRNRIIAGLADAVLVVEAAERSGALNTAAHALDQGKDVLAVPGNITAPQSAGCNRLIAQGATPYLGPDSLLDLLFPERLGAGEAIATALPEGDTPEEKEVIRCLAAGARAGGEILRRSGKLDATALSRALTTLEIKGMVRSLGGEQWCLR